MEKNYKVNDDLTLEMDGKVYRLTKDNLENCDYCPLHKIQGCIELCYATYYGAAETPSFGYNDAIFVEVTENKETNMKKDEIDYKALYEETISKLKIAKENVGYYTFSEVIDKVIPEVADSEDEMIRKELIEYFEWNAQILDNFDNKDVIAWLKKQSKNDMGISEATKQKLEDSLNKVLEKETPESWNESLEKQGEQPKKHDVCDNCEQQGSCVSPCCVKLVEKNVEQKPTDKVEPKFHEGDWLIYENGSIYYVNKVYEHTYELIIDNGDKLRIPHELIDKKARLWTIQDAKDGDVLCCNQIIILFKQWEFKTVNYVIAHAGIDISGKLQITDSHWLISNESKPATQEQRDLLFQKMKNAGYRWNEEKKELRKIEQNPAWSEEDKENISMLIDLVESKEESMEVKIELSAWLKSLKDRMIWKPTERQMDDFYMVLMEYGDRLGVKQNPSYQSVKYIYEQLKKLVNHDTGRKRTIICINLVVWYDYERVIISKS